ncbi:hypothetical protein M3Y98_00705600 [Aphelenchoides besseyi]|nr:hypothetical protein M3Y98_00705600 [Aphelenchoides besseyi]
MPNVQRRRSRSRNARRANWFSRVFGGRQSETAPANKSEASSQTPTPKADELTFECQLAHGSRTMKIPGVGGHQQMYKSIAEAFKLDASDILFCTTNTYKPEMDKLLTSAIPLNSIIFAHLRGQKKEVTLEKGAELLGLTITDNFAGNCLVKRIREGSICGRASPAIQMGDHIEGVNGESVIGKRHFQVANMLRNIPVGQRQEFCASEVIITLRLVSPLSSGFSFVGQQQVPSTSTQKLSGESGNQTIRFFLERRSGNRRREFRFYVHSFAPHLQEEPDHELIAKINAILEEYLGVNDDDLALNIWELGRDCSDLLEMRDRLRQSVELSPFQFPDELVFDFWGVVTDQKAKKCPRCF